MAVIIKNMAIQTDFFSNAHKPFSARRAGSDGSMSASGSMLGGVVNFHLKIFNLGARRSGDVHFLIARLYITGLD